MRTTIYLFLLLLLGSLGFSSCKKDTPRVTSLRQIEFKESVWSGTISYLDAEGEPRQGLRRVSLAFTHDGLVQLSLCTEGASCSTSLKTYQIGTRTLSLAPQDADADREAWYLTSQSAGRIVLERDMNSPHWAVMTLERKL